MPKGYDSMAGYLIVPHEKVPENYNGGFSMHIAAWPLVKDYPGNYFQTGLFGTWMFAQKETAPEEKAYSDIEGGLGWWRDTRFGTATPKFIMGGVARDFCAWANGPAAGKGRDWDNPCGKYGVVQLSSQVLWPPDGLNLKQGTCGELFGYGYRSLPLIPAKPTTEGANIPTGGNCWTLFLNAENLKGPIAFFSPYFFSKPTVDAPRFAERFLDARPAGPNRAIQMETQYVPAKIVALKDGATYARVAPTYFPLDAAGESVVMCEAACYTKDALWDQTKAWFDGGEPVHNPIDADESCLYEFLGTANSTWRIYEDGVERDDRRRMEWDFAIPFAPNGSGFGYRWDDDWVTRIETANGPVAMIPEFYRVKSNVDGPETWEPIRPEDVPAETGLGDVVFEPHCHDDDPNVDPDERNDGPYVTPEEADSCWKTPGPVAGPFEAYPGDGSVVTYYWYRFADQPSMLNADLTDDEREQVQKKVEKLHAEWTSDRTYMRAPGNAELAEIDAALIVTPPPGLEIGYVPIATRQERVENM